MKKVFKPKERTANKAARPTRPLALGFFLLILTGAALLSLPVSSRSGEATNFLDALFTATSATCVTGLVPFDTYSHWSFFGQAVLLVLIQIGGLGFMTLATLFSFLLRRTITMRERLVMTTSFNLVDMAGVVRLTKKVLLGTLFFEGMGAVVLSIRFSADYGFAGGVWKGIFHSISAFCNAGFDLMGEKEPLSSLTHYVGDPVVNLTIMILIVVGGLGFFVWSDLGSHKSVRKLEVHTKLTLIMTGLLILGGAILFFLYEFHNPATLGAMPVWEKALAACFQSVTTRTAGFNSIDQAALTSPSVALTMILMFIGGSPGSTAGGVKTVTIAVLFLTASSVVRGKSKVNLFGRSISPRSIMNAVTVLVIGIVLVAGGSLVISSFENVPLELAVYEAVSAFGTAGLSMGLTPQLGVLSQLTLIALMYLGRVGILTLGIAVLMRQPIEPKIKYPECRVMIG